MKRLVIYLLIALSVATTNAAADYANTLERAQRSFDNKEWANAAALYGLLLTERPTEESNYGRAIVAYSMLSDSAACVDIFERAQAHGVSADSLFNTVKTSSFVIGKGEIYADFLHLCRRDAPWMARAVDNKLLQWYIYRADGVMIIQYADTMLSGLPDSIVYLSDLAYGYSLEGQHDMAVKTWQRILAIQPDDYDTLLKLGNYYALTADRDAALKYLNQAYAINPTPYLTTEIERLKAN
jgi:tetratricopeptide (TPR) repeat protein